MYSTIRMIPFPDRVSEDHFEKVAQASRLSALALTGLMDTGPEGAFDTLTAIGSLATAAPICVFSLVAKDRQFLKSRTSPEGTTLPEGTEIDLSLCQYVVSAGTPLAVEDARGHPLLRSHRAITELEVVAYIGVPVRGPEGEILGTLCAIDTVPHAWTDTDLRVLLDLGLAIEAELAHRQEHISDRLLLADCNHRFGNLIALVRGLVSLSAMTASTVPEMRDTLVGRIEALARANMLTAVGTEDADERRLPLRTVVLSVLEPFLRNRGGRLRVEGCSVDCGPVAISQIAIIVYELVSNSVKYGGLSVTDGGLSLIWRIDDERMLAIDWEEAGTPRPEHKSTRTGFGKQIVSMAVRRLSGTLDEGRRGANVTYRLRLPLDRLTA